jgi:hypothetical protein
MFEETQINEILCNEETQVNEILYNEETSSTLSQESLDPIASSSLIPTPLTSIPLTSTIKTQSIAWQYFNKVYDEKGKHIQSKCKYCTQIYNKETSTTILKEH